MCVKQRESKEKHKDTPPFSVEIYVWFKSLILTAHVFIQSSLLFCTLLPFNCFVASGQGPLLFHLSRNANWLSHLGQWRVAPLV